jgi:hypothetical protein
MIVTYEGLQFEFPLLLDSDITPVTDVETGGARWQIMKFLYFSSTGLYNSMYSDDSSKNLQSSFHLNVSCSLVSAVLY